MLKTKKENTPKLKFDYKGGHKWCLLGTTAMIMDASVSVFPEVSFYFASKLSIFSHQTDVLVINCESGAWINLWHENINASYTLAPFISIGQEHTKVDMVASPCAQASH